MSDAVHKSLKEGDTSSFLGFGIFEKRWQGRRKEAEVQNILSKLRKFLYIEEGMKVADMYGKEKRYVVTCS